MGVNSSSHHSSRYYVVLHLKHRTTLESSAVRSGSILNISLCTPSWPGALLFLLHFVLLATSLVKISGTVNGCRMTFSCLWSWCVAMKRVKSAGLSWSPFADGYFSLCSILLASVLIVSARNSLPRSLVLPPFFSRISLSHVCPPPGSFLSSPEYCPVCFKA